LIFLGNFRVCYRVRVTRRVRITRRVQVWNYFFTRMRVRVNRRVKFCGCGYGYGWTLPVGYVPVAILGHQTRPLPAHALRGFTHSLSASCMHRERSPGCEASFDPAADRLHCTALTELAARLGRVNSEQKGARACLVRHLKSDA
jgi:hypothetical protein